MKFYLFIIALLFIGNAAFSQSFFKPLPKAKTAKFNPFSRALAPTVVADSTFTGFRPIVSAVYSYSKDGGSTLMTGVGASYEHDTWQPATQKWYTNYSIAGLAYAGGSAAPTNLSGVLALGLQISFFNKLLSIGGAYNFVTKTIMPTIGASVSLNN